MVRAAWRLGMRKAFVVVLLVSLVTWSVRPASAAAPPPSQKPIVDDRSQRDARDIPALRSLAYQGNEASLRTLTALAEAGSWDAAFALYTLAMWSDAALPDSMLALDLKPSVRQAQQGRPEAVMALYAFDLWGYQGAGEALAALDPRPFLPGATSHAALALTTLADSGSVASEAFLKTFDPRPLLEQAERGSSEAVLALDSLAYWGNPLQIHAALRTLVPAPFLHQLSEPGSPAIPALCTLAFSDNRSAVNALLDSLSRGNREAGIAIGDVANKRILSLRKAHLREKISDTELDRRLTSQTFDDNPLILYSGYTSSENFGVLSRMILRRLVDQANRRGTNLYSFLKALDPQRIFYQRFVLQAANFSQLQEVISSEESLDEMLDYLFRDSDEIAVRTHGVRLAFFIGKVSADTGWSLQKEFQDHLMRLYALADGVNQHFIAAVLSIYRRHLRFLRQDDIGQIAAKHGIRSDDTEVDYSRLLSGSKLLVHMVFADKDAVRGFFDRSVKSFQRPTAAGGGYKTVASSAYQTILEKGDIRVVFVNTLDEGYDVNQGLDHAGLIVSRGHDGSVGNVFRRQRNPVDSKGKVFVVSGCRTLTFTGRLSSYYPGASFISVDGTSYGERTDLVVYYLLEALRRRIATFKQVEAFVGSHVGKVVMKDYVFPDDDALKVERNVMAFLARQDATERQRVEGP